MVWSAVLPLEAYRNSSLSLAYMSYTLQRIGGVMIAGANRGSSPGLLCAACNCRYMCSYESAYHALGFV